VLEENKFRYSIHGDDTNGWSLNVYKYVFHKEILTDAVSTHWREPKQFDTFAEVVLELNKFITSL
jgi:hypothetical protein